MAASRTIGELFPFLTRRRAWFLIPNVAGLLTIGIPLGPFIYTIF